MLQEPWRAEFLGRLLLRSGKDVYTRFRDRKAASLLAMLCFQENGVLPREQCVEQLWPEEPPEVSRNRFRVALHRLRQILEPPGVEPGTVLRADRLSLSLNPEAMTSDVGEFLAALNTAAKRPPQAERIALLERAAALYDGELIPGFDEPWIETERARLADLHFHGLRDLVRALITAPPQIERALPYARQAVSLEPYEEEAHCDLIRLYGASGKLTEALKQYEALERLLAHDLGARPSAGAQRLAQLLRSHLGHGVKTGPPGRPLADLLVADAPAPAQDAAAVPVEPLASPIPLPSGAPPEMAQPAGPALPLRLTRFFGREDDIAALCPLLQPASPTRLVTLLGPGGIGKTRLALEAAQRLEGAYGARIYFATLADVFSTWQVGEAILEAMRRLSDPQESPLSQAMAALGEAPSLLVLDNLEHLFPEVRYLIRQLLETVGNLRCLATSRQIVGLEGEVEYPVEPLPVPSEGVDAAELRDFPGTALFLDRARAARADFTLTERNAADIAWLCRRLDGLPLALELAAARVRAISVPEMRAEMSRMLEWLVDLRGGKETRHRSLRAAILWSHQLLTPVQQQALHMLSVFMGGFIAQGAAAVCADLFTSRSELQLALEELCSASLLTAQENAEGRVRFGMLESLRAFGQEQLEKSGLEAVIHHRHLCWCVQLVETLETAELATLRALAEDEANLRAALQYGLSPEAPAEDQVLAVTLAPALLDHWVARGILAEGRRWLEQALELPVAETVLARARTAAARLAIHQGDYEEGGNLARTGKELAEAREDRRELAENLFNLGLIAFHTGRYLEAERHMEEARTLFVTLEARRRCASCLIQLGLVAWFQGYDDVARPRMEEALAIYRALGSERGIANCLLKLGNVARNRGDWSEGQALITQALQAFRDLQEPIGIASALHDLGLVAIARLDYALSESYFRQALTQFREIGLQNGWASSLVNIAEAQIQTGRSEEAIPGLLEGLARWRRQGDLRGIATSLRILCAAQRECGRPAQALEAIREAMQFEQALDSPNGVALCLEQIGEIQWETGDLDLAETTLSEAVAIHCRVGIANYLAHALFSCARLAQSRGNCRKTVRLLGLVQTLLDSKGNLNYLGDALQIQTTLEEARRQLGEAEVDREWNAGKTLSPLDAIR